ncbi:MAG: CaiB/BaiF CoA transferase family protein [Novosphingobium sp.]
MSEAAAPTGPLAGIRVLDLSRVLAGPWCSQILGDLGAEVIKIESLGQGDDTRPWGPPFLPDGSGDSAYYLAANRNKRSVQVNLADPAGAELIRKLAARADIVLENFKVGGLAKYGLDYASLKALKPDLIYCSITGFGQTGPYKDRGGYDFLIQGMSGVMSVTGHPDGVPGAGPMKAGISVSDLGTGLYAAISILAALHHRTQTGEGQHIDLALLDSQLALLASHASSWLNGESLPKRWGNAHPSLTPYQDFACIDGAVLVALGNDRQFAAFARLLGLPEMADDPRFTTNPARNQHRPEMIAALADAIAQRRADELVAAMEAAGLPGGKVNDVPTILADPHVAARGQIGEIARDDGTPVRFLGYPAKFSATPPNYRRAPPRAGGDTADVLGEELGLGSEEIALLKSVGAIG